MIRIWEIDARSDRVRWLVEVLLDTGQRMLSSEMGSRAAAELVSDMIGRTSTVLVTAINVATGEALQELGCNVWAASGLPALPEHRARRRRELIAERLG